MLIEAIETQDEDRVHEVLAARPDAAEERSSAGVSALMLAHYYGVDATAEIRRARTTPLDVFEAATVGDLERLRELLDADPELARARSVDDGTALHFAAFFGQATAARVLIERGADVEAIAPTFGNVRPLHSAAAASNVEAAVALLAVGADPNARQEKDFTPLHSAAANGSRELVDALIEHGADPAATNADGKNAADFAAEKGHEELATLLRARP